MFSSDGVRVYVNGVLVIDKFTDQSTRWTDGQPIHLTAVELLDRTIRPTHQDSIDAHIRDTLTAGATR